MPFSFFPELYQIGLLVQYNGQIFKKIDWQRMCLRKEEDEEGKPANDEIKLHISLRACVGVYIHENVYFFLNPLSRIKWLNLFILGNKVFGPHANQTKNNDPFNVKGIIKTNLTFTTKF